MQSMKEKKMTQNDFIIIFYKPCTMYPLPDYTSRCVYLVNLHIKQ